MKEIFDLTNNHRTYIEPHGALRITSIVLSSRPIKFIEVGIVSDDVNRAVGNIFFDDTVHLFLCNYFSEFVDDPGTSG